MVEENIRQEFRPERQNEWMNRNHKKFCETLNYIKHFLFQLLYLLDIFQFLLLLLCLVFAQELQVLQQAIAAGIKKYKPIIKKKKTKHDKIVLLAKSKLNNIGVLISKTLIDSNISHDEFVLLNNVLKEYEEVKEEIKNLKT